MEVMYIPYDKKFVGCSGKEVCDILNIKANSAACEFGFRYKDVQTNCCGLQCDIDDDVCPKCKKTIIMVDCFSKTFDGLCNLLRETCPFYDIVEGEELGLFMKNVFRLTFEKRGELS